MNDKDNFWMNKALALADEAFLKNEIPIGAVIVFNDEIIGSGYNMPISTNDPSSHAEINAIRNACKFLANYRLINAKIYVTLEPCLMCLGAILHSRIDSLIFGAFDNEKGVFSNHLNFFKNYKFNHKIKYKGGILKDDCSRKLKEFFELKRNNAL